MNGSELGELGFIVLPGGGVVAFVSAMSQDFAFSISSLGLRAFCSISCS